MWTFLLVVSRIWIEQFVAEEMIMGWLNLDAGNGLSGVKSGIQRGLDWCYQMCLQVQALSIGLGLIDTKIRCGVVGVFGSPDR